MGGNITCAVSSAFVFFLFFFLPLSTVERGSRGEVL
jgi:hypothetical protein